MTYYCDPIIIYRNPVVPKMDDVNFSKESSSRDFQPQEGELEIKQPCNIFHWKVPGVTFLLVKRIPQERRCKLLKGITKSLTLSQNYSPFSIYSLLSLLLKDLVKRTTENDGQRKNSKINWSYIYHVLESPAWTKTSLETKRIDGKSYYSKSHFS